MNNTYLLDPEAEEEMIRLARQGRLITQSLGLLPPNIDPFQFPSAKGERPSILDIGCATGEWSLEFAATYRHVQIIGLDISKRMIDYANWQAENQEVAHIARFMVGNALQRLPFADQSFDLVNIRMALGFLPKNRWVDVFQECYRVLKEQGMLLSTESDTGVTTWENPATAQIQHWLTRLLWISGLGFWDGVSSSTGIHAMQPVFLKEAGFTHLEYFPKCVFSSYGTENYQAWLDALPRMIMSVKFQVINKLGVKKEDFERIYAECCLESQQATYNQYSVYLSLTGRKINLE